MGKIKDFYNRIVTPLFPNRCPFCFAILKENQYSCKKCRKTFPPHGICQGVSYGYRCTSALPYFGKFKRAVLRYKFHNKTRYSKHLAHLLAIDIKRSYEDIVFDYVTYVPMHTKDFEKRGYNQCELLAKELSYLLGIPYKKTLVKVKHTKPQHKLSAKKRRKNLKGAFKVIDKKLVKDKSVLIIDDIVTTGTTLGECAKALQKAHPTHICCATILATGNLYC